MAKAVGSILVGNWIIQLFSVVLVQLGQPPLLHFPWSSLGQEAGPCLTTGLPSQGDPRREGAGGQEPSDGGAARGQSFLLGSVGVESNKPRSQISLMEITQLGKGKNLAWAHPSGAWLTPPPPSVTNKSGDS